MELSVPKDMNPAPALAVTIGQYSDAGRKSANQDFHGAATPEGLAMALKGVTVAVADGLSSSAVGREAAELAVKSLLTDYYGASDTWTVKTAASRVIAATNAWFHAQNRRARLEEMEHGWVCTLAAIVLKGRSAHLFHVGDSRIWRASGESLEPLTEDHRISLSSTETYLGRCLGAEHQVEIDYRQIDLAVGDVLVLTTDGVHDHMDPRWAARTIKAADDLEAAAAQIAAEALARGSDDNLTIQIVRVDALPGDGADRVLDEASSLPTPPLPQAGDVIDGYRILRQLHASSRSHVYLAAAPDGSEVVMKIPSVDQRGDREALHRLFMEEWIARRLTSAHVLKVPPLQTARTALYVVTEYVDGQTLRQWMHDHPRPDLEDVRRIVDQIVQGLRAFHRREMLHQDLRPENIMIDRHGTVKIIDFGSVAVAGVQEAQPGGAEAILGTQQYTAPEYFSGDVVGWRSDLFSLGVIAYEMLTGRLPYGAQVSRVRTRAQQRRLVYRPACDDDHPVPDWMDEALRRALHPDPSRRHEALSEFAADLHGPSREYRARRHTPLIERDPLLFWKGLSAVLAVLCLILAARLAG